MHAMTENQKIIKLAAEVGCSPATARKWWKGERVYLVIANGCEVAAKKLGYERPEPGQCPAVDS